MELPLNPWFHRHRLPPYSWTEIVHLFSTALFGPGRFDNLFARNPLFWRLICSHAAYYVIRPVSI